MNLDHAGHAPHSVGGWSIFEDAHLLVANKPAGMNTHAPAPYAGEGLYDWLRHREPRWADLSIIHRLDKETSGVLVFGKSVPSNRSLTAQFAGRTIRKGYLLVTDRPLAWTTLEVVSGLARAGDKYVMRPISPGSPRAETHFRVVSRAAGRTWVEAEPVTGRTHQIRVHAAARGFPVLGDALYGGANWKRVCLHARSLTLTHPVSGEPMTFTVEPDFEGDARLAMRELLIDRSETTAFRIRHGAGDGEAGWYVDRLGDYLLSQGGADPLGERLRFLTGLPAVHGIYHKRLDRQLRRVRPEDACPHLIHGTAAKDRLVARENGLQFELSFREGYSVGLFLDQRDNRRRFLTNYVAADFPLFSGSPAGQDVLNAFAYTCSFSVCAACAGARVTSLDLSRKYLDWGRRNFLLNGLDPDAHEFVCGDVFDWFKRFAKKQRRFDAIILDPPTFSQSKTSGVFRAEADYGKLAGLALALLKPGGVLFSSTNAGSMTPEAFLGAIRSALVSSGRRLLAQHYVPQSFDFPMARTEPGHLKTVWLRVG